MSKSLKNPNELRLSQSALAAQRLLTQVIEVLFGKEVLLDELTIRLGKITRETSLRIGLVERSFKLSGIANLRDEQGKLLAPFKFILEDLYLQEWEAWVVADQKMAKLSIDGMTLDHQRDYSVYWQRAPSSLMDRTPPLIIAYRPKSDNYDLRVPRVLGRTRQDRREDSME